MNVTRRDLIKLLAIAASAGVAPRQLEAADGPARLLAFEPLGNVTLLHITDSHATLRPVFYREPDTLLGVGGERGRPPFVTGAGDAPRITSSIVVALYDLESGAIRHLHTVHVHEGAREVSEADAIEDARRHARTLGHDTERLGTAVSGEAVHGELPHRVEPATGAFHPIVLAESAL